MQQADVRANEGPHRHAEMARIVSAARPLYERLQEDDGGGADPQRALALDAAQVALWRQVTEGAGGEALERRLAWDGIRLQAEPASGRPPRAQTKTPWPGWAGCIADAGEEARRFAPIFRESGLESEPNASIPFADLLVPFVSVARARLTAAAGSTLAVFAPDAVRHLERQLRRDLASIAALTFQAEFAAARSLWVLAGDPAADLPAGPPGTKLYRRFVAEALGDGLLPMFQRYPVLARLMGTVVEAWAGNVAEVAQRLAADHPAICAAFFGGRDVGRVAAVATQLSDAHRGGRRVLGLTFESGGKLIYKPRPLEVERAFYKLLAAVNREVRGASLRVLAMLPRQGYGWVEFVEGRPCRSPRELAAFYRRLGRLACLVYALDGTDGHCENLIAAGDQPVLVDLETLFHPSPRLEPGAAPLSEEELLRLDDPSILTTGLFPVSRPAADGVGADTSALGGDPAQATRVRGWYWSNVNRDDMSAHSAPVATRAAANRPVAEARPAAVAAHGGTLVRGFREVYAFLAGAGRPRLEAALRGLFSGQVRHIFRDTQVYASLQKDALHPRWLGDGLTRSIRLDRLCRGLLQTRRRPLLWPLLRAEHEALERLDIPLFTAPIDGNALVTDTGGSVPGCLADAPRTRVAARIRRLGPEDELVQAGLIRGALAAAAWERPAAGEGEPCLVAVAEAIARQLGQAAVARSDGSRTWTVARFRAGSRVPRLQPMGDGLYDGRAGMALFLAALARVTGDADHRRRARSLLDALAAAREGGAQPGDEADGRIGAATGLGSLAYVFTRASGLLGGGLYLEAALEVARAIDPAAIAADPHLDVMAGAAGAALALLRLHGATGEGWLLERAVLCGRRLLAASVAESGRRSWTTAQGPRATGFAHGASGIAHALVALAAASGAAEFEAAALEGLRDEAEAAAGPEPAAAGSRLCAWCNGAAGMGLARLAVLERVDRADVREAAVRAARATLAAGAADQDQICCGSLGRVELLLGAGPRLGLPAMEAAGRRLRSEVVCGALRRGRFLGGLAGGVAFHPGFFQGTAGIGYQLLRAAEPELLPAVLLWD
jgi:type 2 lantibiotic biosynthesis protein LanM